MNDPNNVSSFYINLRPFLPQVLLPGTREKREGDIERKFAIDLFTDTAAQGA